MGSGEEPQTCVDVLDSDTEDEAPTRIGEEQVGGVAH